MAIQPAEAGPSTPPTGRQPQYKLAHSLSGHPRGVTALRFSPDGRSLVSAGADGLVHVWNAITGEHERQIRAHRAGINDLSISPDGLYIATASDDNRIHLHHLHEPIPLPPRAAAPSDAPELDASIPGASTSETTPNPSANGPLRRMEGHTAPVLCTAFSPKSDCIASGSFDESVILWDVRRGGILKVLPAHSEAVWTVGWDREASMVLTGSADGTIRIWDAHTGQCLKTLENDTNSPVSYAAFTPSSTFLLSSTLSSTLRIYNIHTSKVLKTLRAPSIFISEKFPCPALLYPAIPDDSGMDIDTNDAPSTSTLARAGQGAGSKNAKGEAWVISGSENGKVVIWELSTRRVAQVLDRGGHTAPVVALAVSPDGRRVATGSLEPERIIHLWRDSA